MNNNKISNTKVEVPKGTTMNDKDYITSVLAIEKYIVKDLAVAMTEASNNDLYNEYYDMYDEISDIQRQLYNLMFKKGWYCLEMAEENKIMEKLNKLNEETKQISTNE